VNRAELLLVWWLRICAGVLLLAAVAIVLPFATMKTINDAIGLAELPDTPLINYLTRSVSALYVFQGLLLLYLSFDVRRYPQIITFVAWVNIGFGVFMLILDTVIGMPWLWTIAEGSSILSVGMVILCLKGCGA
jgi:hypothetical protein